MDQNGYAGIVESNGQLSEDLGKLVVNPDPNQVSYSAIIDQALTLVEDNAVVVIDMKRRQVFFTTDAAIGTAMKNAVGAEEDEKLTLKPDANQTGRSLAWSILPGGTLAAPNITSAIAAQKPKRSLGSLLTTALNALPEELQVEEPPVFVVIDQAAATVKICTSIDPAAVATGLDETDDAAAGKVKVVISLTEPEATEGVALKPFEGGAV